LSKTIAKPQDDCSYKITKTKIFITYDEHDLSENIIHLVLAKTPNTPKRIKNINLFLLPKFIPNDNDSVGERNKLKCISIEKKMGINTIPTCVMHYNDAKGWLVPDLNKSMRAIFIIMNGARLMVGFQKLRIADLPSPSPFYYAPPPLHSLY
jgi:Acyl-CoA dehydrogenases